MIDEGKDSMNVIISLCQKILIDLAPVLLLAFFIYRVLNPKHRAKYGVWTPIIYAGCIVIIRIILNEIGEPGTLLKEIIHILGMEASYLILSFFLFCTDKKRIVIKTVICMLTELIFEIAFGEVVDLLLQVNFHLLDSYSSTGTYISKILFFPILYIIFLVWEIWQQKNKEKLTRYITGINIIIALIQLFMLLGMVQKSFSTFEQNRYSMTIISNLFLLLGYFIVTEVFGELIKQQEKESEMKKMKSERRYQYNYYRLAQKQGEEIRDIRHDLRNQLQTIQYMLKSRDEQGEKTGREMFEKLKERVDCLE